MTQTQIASVTIERLRVLETQPTEYIGGGPREMGTHEWHMKITVNGQTQWWTRHGIEAGGEYVVGRHFPYVPLIEGGVSILIEGWEQDTFGDTELDSRFLSLNPAENYPYGVYGVWVTSYESGYYGELIAESGLGNEGAYDFRITIAPVGAKAENPKSGYAVLIRDRAPDLGLGQGYSVSGWDGFTKTIDAWRGFGLRLSRVASCEAHPGQPSFAAGTERTYLGMWETGDTGMPFWELDENGFRAKLDEHWKEGISATDVYAYRDEGATPVIGGTFDRGRGRTELVTGLLAEFGQELDRRASQGQGLIALDTFSDGRERRYVGLVEHGVGGSVLWVGAGERDFRARDEEFRRQGLRLIDFCTFNDGGSQLFCGVWRPGDWRTWLTLEPDWANLVSRINYNWSQGWQVIALDAWSSAATD